MPAQKKTKSQLIEELELLKQENARLIKQLAGKEDSSKDLENNHKLSALSSRYEQILQAVSESEQQYRALFHQAGDAMFIHPGGGRFVDINEAACTLLGYSRSELLQLGPFEITARSTKKTSEYIGDVKKSGHRVFETNMLYKDGREIPVELSSRIIDYRNEPAILSIVRDISGRKKVETDLLASKERYHRLNENAQDIIWRTDAKGKVLYVNSAVERILGYSVDEALGKPITEYLTDKSVKEIRALIKEALAFDPVQYSFSCEVDYFHRDRHPVSAEFRATMIPDESGEIIEVEGISRDITDRKRVEKERVLLEEQLQQNQRQEAIGRLAGGIAHDFNNLLMGVLGGASLLKRKIRPGTQEYRRLEIIENSAEQAANLTNQLLAFAKGGKYQPLLLNLNDLIRKTFDLPDGCSGSKVRFDMFLDSQLKKVEADQAQIIQVIMNLCNNSQEAMTEAGEILIETFAVDSSKLPSILKSTGREYNALRISDTGPGVAPELQGRIFEPFFTTKDFGRGLGLAAVFGIVQNHNGHIEYESLLPHGARFTIYLPISTEVAVPVPKKAALEEADTPVGPITVMVVDDEEIPRESAASILQSLGHRVLEADSGSQALEIFKDRKGQIDLIILDAVMPEMSGTETFRKLLALEQDVRVIFSSGYLEDMVLTAEDNEKMSGFIKKPYEVNQLGKILQVALAV